MPKQLLYIFLLFCVIFSFTLSWALSYLIDIAYWELFIDSFIQALVFSGTTFFILQIIRYGNYSALSIYQRAINYLAIGSLSIGVWLAISYGVFYLFFGENDSALIVKTFWIKGFVGILMFLLIIQYFHYKTVKNTSSNTTEDFVEENYEETTSDVSENEIIERIAIKNGQKIHVIVVSEIIFIQAEGDYVKIYTEKGKFLKEETMKYFQEHLPQKQFVRVHRSYIVNVGMIHRIEVYEKQNQLITLKNGEQIKVSSAGYKQLKSALNL